MEAKETGGTAFPSLIGVMTGIDSDGMERWETEPSGGMTLHDYFMAHAPVEPQDWFLPVMPPCPVVPSIRGVTHTPFRVDLQVQEEFNPEDQSPEARKWFEAQGEAEDAQANWQADFRKQRYVQWPSAWADAMLEQRKC